MKKFILPGLLILSLAWPAVLLATDNPPPHRLLTAVDLLKNKGLTPFTPNCVIGSTASGLVTAEDLLRIKGLLGSINKSDSNTPEEDDIWGMGQDFGC